jgi:putative MATE family efflux protein
VASDAETLVNGGSAALVVEQGLSRAIFKLAWPLVVERLSLSLLSGVDAALVGRYVGADGVAAVGVASLLFWIVLSGAIAVDIGATAIIARDTGAGERARAGEALQTAVLIGFAWGLLCTVVIWVLAPSLMQAMGAEESVRPLGVDYLRAGSLAFPLMMALYAISGALRGLGNTWVPMLILVVVNAVNAAVTYLLISGTVADLGVQASGIGYAAAGISGGVLALAFVASSASPVRIDARRLRTSREAIARLLRIGLPVGLEEMQFMFAFLIYTRIIASLGTTQLAAHSLALRSNEIAILPGFALGTAATALVGQCLGAGLPQRAEEAARRIRSYAFAASLVMAGLQFAFAPYILRIFVDDPDVVDTGAKLLRVFAFAQPALAVHGSMSGVLRGAGDVRFVLFSYTCSVWGVRVPIAALMVLGFGLSAPFAWLAAVAENWTRAALVTWRMRTGRWKHMHV